MAANRKLLSEIQQVLKKIEEGVEIFDETMEKVYAAETQTLKEKFEADLKKEIKKLQRLRDQVKNWIGSNEVKDKAQLTEAKRLIETKMESFKICEKDTKTKAYSKEGLAREAKLDPKDALREEKRQWLNDCLEQLQDFINTVEAEKEKLQNSKGKGKNKEAGLEKFDNRIQKHKFHVAKIELIIRLLDAEEIDPASLENIKDSLEYYLETAADDDGALGVEHEFDIYEDLNLDSFTSNHHDFSPRIGQSNDTPTTNAEHPEEKSPAPLTLPEKESHDKDKHTNSHQPEPAAAHPKQSTTGKGTNAKGAAAASHSTGHEKETKTASPATHAQNSNQTAKNTTAATTSGQSPAVTSQHGPTPTAVSHPPAPAINDSHHKPHVTVAQIVAQNVPPPPVTTAPVHTTTAPSLHPPATAAATSGNTNVPPPAPGISPPPSLPATPALTVPTPTLNTPSLTIPAHGPNGLIEDMEKLQLAGRTQAGLPPQPALVPPKMTSPQAMPMQPPLQQLPGVKGSPVKVAPGFPGATPTMGGMPEVPGMSPRANEVPPGVSLTGIIGSSPLLTPAGNAAAINIPGLTPEMMTTLTMLKQSSMCMPEPDQEKISNYAPRNAYNTHPMFPTQPLFSNTECTQLFEKLSWDTFFFAFYFQQGSYQQYLAAKKLKKGSWRFHRKYTTWFQRHNEPKITTKDYEEGTYLYFDYESGWCNRIKTEFKFEYAFLEDEVSIQ